METEAEFLKNYNIKEYERPSVTADIAIFTIMDEIKKNYRKLPEKKLKLLLIKRGKHPYKDCWALPGGFMEKGETLDECAKRELKEETGVENAHLEFVKMFTESGRDQRGWIISGAYMALMDYTKCSVEAADDAIDAVWFTVDFKEVNVEKHTEEEKLEVKITHSLTMTYGEDTLTATVEELRVFTGYDENIEYKIIEQNGFAFDHCSIIVNSIMRLRERVENGNLAFSLLPTKFTMSDLQRVYEIILNKELIVANFRRKISKKVIETDEMTSNAGHRPAKLYKKHLPAFYKENIFE